MIYKKILLKDIDKRFDNENLSLSIYISDVNESVTTRPGMLICPGGGYSYVSPREAEPVAFRFLSEGFNCFILNYSTNKKYPAPHLDLALAVHYIKEHEKEFNLIPNSLSLMGFSAGGHLVASYSYLYKELAKELGLDAKKLKPSSIVLGYPVISTLAFQEQETRKNISEENPILDEKLDIPTHIDKNYPPTFVFTTKDDKVVPYQNTLMLEEALKNNKIKYQCIIFESGLHGGSVVNRSCYKKNTIPPLMEEERKWPVFAADFVFKTLKL